MSAAAATDEPKQKKKGKRRKMPSAADQTIPGPFELRFDDVPVVVRTMKIKGKRRREDDNAEVFDVEIGTSWDVASQDGALPFAHAFRLVREEQADVGPKAKFEASMTRGLAPVRLVLTDKMMAGNVAMSGVVKGKLKVKLIGEKKVRCLMTVEAEVLGGDALVGLAATIGRAVDGSCSPAQGDLFD